MIDSLTSGLVTTDLDGRILTFNRAAEAITGHARRRGVGQRRSPTCCSCPPEFAAALEPSAPTRGSRRADFRYRRPGRHARSSSA